MRKHWEMDEEEFSYFEYFSGYVPAGVVFRMVADDTARIAQNSSEDVRGHLNSLCLIGLVSYFEAFAKDQIASAISIAPEIIDSLKQGGHRTDLAADDVYEYIDRLQYMIGFLISQNLDAGSAKKINSIYTSALKITPFGKDEVKAYERLLRDRNLIVHHGGAYTTSYIRQAFDEIPSERRRAHGDSLEVTTDRILSEVEFLKKIAKKIVLSTSEILKTIIRNRYVFVPKQLSGAVNAMAWWDEDIVRNADRVNIDDLPF